MRWALPPKREAAPWWSRSRANLEYGSLPPPWPRRTGRMLRVARFRRSGPWAGPRRQQAAPLRIAMPRGTGISKRAFLVLPQHAVQGRVEEILSRLENAGPSPVYDGQGLISESREGPTGNASPRSKDWPHAPPHRLSENGTYMVTSGTLHKEHYFRDRARLDLLAAFWESHVSKG